MDSGNIMLSGVVNLLKIIHYIKKWVIRGRRFTEEIAKYELGRIVDLPKNYLKLAFPGYTCSSS